jgi:thiamine transporter
MKSGKTLFLVEIAIMAALALLLDIASTALFSRIWPQGGTVSIAMVPVFIMAIRRGIKGGLVTGFIFGLLQFITGFAQIYHPVQGFIDYFVAFTVLGFAGIFTNQIKAALQRREKGKWITYTILACFLGCALRFLAHFYTGIVFFGSYAPKGQPVALYSFIYNGTYMLPTFILSAAVVVLLLITAPKAMVGIKK